MTRKQLFWFYLILLPILVLAVRSYGAIEDEEWGHVKHSQVAAKGYDNDFRRVSSCKGQDFGYYIGLPQRNPCWKPPPEHIMNVRRAARQFNWDLKWITPNSRGFTGRHTFYSLWEALEVMYEIEMPTCSLEQYLTSETERLIAENNYYTTQPLSIPWEFYLNAFWLSQDRGTEWRF